jgi:ribose 5-phosphate isomerase B
MSTFLRLAVGGDHAGFAQKGAIIAFLSGLGHTVEDCGSHDPAPVDFPDVSVAVCERVLSGHADRGILICGSGVGACIAANKVPGIRASLIHDIYCAHQCVEHDDVNVACIGTLVVGMKVIEDCLPAFLNATYSTDVDIRRRVEKLTAIERRTDWKRG